MTDGETDDDRTLEQRIEAEMVNEDHPLEALLVGEDERPEAIDVNEDITIDTEAFIDRLDALADAAAVVGSLADDVAALRRSGLQDDDVAALIYGRKHTLGKTNVRAVLDALDDISGAGGSDREDLLVMLVRDISHVNKREVEQVFDELRRLRGRYGGDQEDSDD